jgi:hypothetical protein
VRRLELDALLGGAAADALSLAVVAYLLVPALLFAGGFLWAPVAIAATGAGVAAFGLSPGWRAGWPLGRRATFGCLLGGLAWGVGATGTHHLLYAAADWQIRDAVLHDLAAGGWPVAYAIGPATWLLRAPLGYYLPAALAGPAVAPAALWLWTATGLGLVLALLVALARQGGLGRRGTVLLCLVFVGFGGLDLLPNLWLDATEGAGIASYVGRGGEWWARSFQYSGHATLLLWAPNHALPGWLPALLLARHGRRAEFAASAGLPLGAAALWAPVAAAGAAVLALVALAGQRGGPRAALAGAPNWLALGLVAPGALFLAAGAARVPHGWLVAEQGAGALGTVALFVAVELAAAWPLLVLARWRLLAAGLVLLGLLPLYVFGPGNEMTMRGGIAPLALLAVAAGLAVRRGAPGRWRALLGGVVLVGALGQAMEASILIHPPWRASGRCTLPEAAAQSVFEDSTDWSHYVVPWPDPLLARTLAAPAPRAVDPASVALCWADGQREDERR